MTSLLEFIDNHEMRIKEYIISKTCSDTNLSISNLLSKRITVPDYQSIHSLHMVNDKLIT